MSHRKAVPPVLLICFEFDRSKRCRKCRGEGHMFRECKAEPECMLYKGKKGVDCGYVAGSSRGLVFRRALNAIKK